MPLEFIHGPNACTRNALLELEYLSVVGGDDQNILKSNRFLYALPIDPSAAGI